MSILKDPPVPFILINGWLVMCTPSSAVWRLQVDSGPADPVSGGHAVTRLKQLNPSVQVVSLSPLIGSLLSYLFVPAARVVLTVGFAVLRPLSSLGVQTSRVNRPFLLPLLCVLLLLPILPTPSLLMMSW